MRILKTHTQPDVMGKVPLVACIIERIYYRTADAGSLAVVNYSQLIRLDTATRTDEFFDAVFSNFYLCHVMNLDVRVIVTKLRDNKQIL